MSFAEILSKISRLSFAEQQEWVQSALAVDDAELSLGFCLSAAAQAALGGLLPLEEITGGHSPKGVAGSSKFFRL